MTNDDFLLTMVVTILSAIQGTASADPIIIPVSGYAQCTKERCIISLTMPFGTTEPVQPDNVILSNQLTGRFSALNCGNYPWVYEYQWTLPDGNWSSSVGNSMVMPHCISLPIDERPGMRWRMKLHGFTSGWVGIEQ